MPKCIICEEGKLPDPVHEGKIVDCLMCQGTGEMPQRWYDFITKQDEQS